MKVRMVRCLTCAAPYPSNCGHPGTHTSLVNCKVCHNDHVIGSGTVSGFAFCGGCVAMYRREFATARVTP